MSPGMTTLLAAGAAPADNLKALPTTQTSSLERYLAQIPDPTLRENLAREIAGMGRTFGLVFERHHPEGIRLPKHRVKRGSKVIINTVKNSGYYRVARLAKDDGTAVLVDDDGNEAIYPVDQLTVAKEFGDVMYPGLRKLSEVRNGAPNTPVHTIINGENYHALEALQYTHSGKVDLIYIDPPYNTGNADWKYNDRYIDSKDGYRHSKWLSFMEKRLVLARSLLKPTGVLFMSIDDSEQARLKLLADQVFGEVNFVDTIMLELSKTQGMKVKAAQSGSMVKNGEFVHVYRKSAEFDDVKHTPLYDAAEGWSVPYSYWLADSGEVLSLGEKLMEVDAIRADATLHGISDRLSFPIGKMDTLLAVSPAARAWVESNLARIARIDRAPSSVSIGRDALEGGTYSRYWHGGREYLLTLSSVGEIKQLMTLDRSYGITDDYVPRFTRTSIRGDFWKGFWSDMARVDKEGDTTFKNGKKPTRLMKQLFKWANNSPDTVILDFFGGSGSTAHAVMEMNAEDGGSRQCILVTNNELAKKDDAALRKAGHVPGDDAYDALGVFHSVTKPRLETVVTGVRQDGSKYSDGLDANVAFFELTYLDEPEIVTGRALNDLSGLFWLKAGGSGGTVDIDASAKRDGYAIPESGAAAILFTPGRARALAEQLKATGQNITNLFIVTDSEAAGEEAASHFPLGINVERIYGNYLEAFQVNRKD